MTLLLPISASEVLDAYEQSVRKNPETAIRMVMWLMIYDELQVTWARDFLEEVRIFAKPEAGEAETIRANQLRKVHRLRTNAEKSIGLPGRGKKGASETYRQALNKWRALNPRPSKEQLLAGWSPKPIDLGDSPSVESTAIATQSAPIATAELSPTAAPDTTEVHEPAPDKTASKKPPVPKSPTLPTFVAFADPKNPTLEELQALSRKADEDARQPTKPKPTAPIPPKFNGPLAPANGTKATAEENAEFKAANLAAKENYISQIEADPNWRMKDSWNGRGDPDDYVEYIGPPWE